MIGVTERHAHMSRHIKVGRAGSSLPEFVHGMMRSGLSGRITAASCMLAAPGCACLSWRSGQGVAGTLLAPAAQAQVDC
jgi:hypothetical protein